MINGYEKYEGDSHVKISWLLFRSSAGLSPKVNFYGARSSAPNEFLNIPTPWTRVCPNFSGLAAWEKNCK
jgi:hypothetical protein